MTAVLTRTKRTLPLAVPLIALTILVLVPLGILILTSFLDSPPTNGAAFGHFTLTNYRHLITSGTGQAAAKTVEIAFFGTLLSLLIGVPLAWLVARTDVPGLGLIRLAGFAPLFIPSLVGALAWDLLASPNAGYLNLVFQAIGFGHVNIYSVPGLIFVFGLYYAPYSFIFVSGALALMNPDLEDAASVHRGSRLVVARKVTLPLVTPAVLASGLLTFVLIAENFPVVEVIGQPAGIETLSTRIFRLVEIFPTDPNQAAAVGVLLMLVVLIGVGGQSWLLRGRNYATVTGKGFRPRKVSLGKWRWVAFGFALLYVLVALILPVLALIESAFNKSQYVSGFGDLFNTSNMQLSTFTSALDGDFRNGLENSIYVGLGAAAVAVIVCFICAFVAQKTRLAGRQILRGISILPLAMPAMVIGLGYLWSWPRSPIPIYGTIFILILAFATQFLPQAYEGIRSALVQVGSELEESAYTLGASRSGAAFRITLPLIKLGVGSTAFLVFILAIRELSSALLLYTPSTQVLSIVIYNQWQNGSLSGVASISLCYCALLAVIAGIASRFFGLRRL